MGSTSHFLKLRLSLKEKWRVLHIRHDLPPYPAINECQVIIDRRDGVLFPGKGEGFILEWIK
jgi:hypothetical protein